MNDFDNGFNPTPYNAPPPTPNLSHVNTAKKSFSTVGWALCAVIGVSYVAQFAIGIILGLMGEVGLKILESPEGIWILSFLPLYAAAFPVGLLIMKKLPKNTPKGNGMTAKEFWTVLPITILLMIIGNYIGSFLSMFLSSGNAENALNDLAMQTGIIKVVVMVILAPIFEEYIFRKQLIDRTLVYGEKTAVILSGLLFGLFHTNLFQFFYAFFVGVVFAYVYVRSGKLRYSVILHMIINFFGSVVAPFIISQIDMEALEKMAQYDTEQITDEMLQTMYSVMPGLMMLLGYSFIWGGLGIAGAVLLIINRKRITWQKTELQLSKENVANAVYMNSGIIAFVILSVTLSLVSLFIA